MTNEFDKYLEETAKIIREIYDTRYVLGTEKGFTYSGMDMGSDDLEKTVVRYYRDGVLIDEETLSNAVSSDSLICDHEFVDVGFSQSKFVCKKCDCEK